MLKIPQNLTFIIKPQFCTHRLRLLAPLCRPHAQRCSVSFLPSSSLSRGDSVEPKNTPRRHSEALGRTSPPAQSSVLPFVSLLFVQHERHASPLSPKSTRHRPQRLLMVCLLPSPAPVGLPLYLLRYRTCCFDVASARGFLPILFFSRGPPHPSTPCSLQ